MSHEIWLPKVVALSKDTLGGKEGDIPTPNDYLNELWHDCDMSLERYGQELSKMLRLVVRDALAREIWLSKVMGL